MYVILTHALPPINDFTWRTLDEPPRSDRIGNGGSPDKIPPVVPLNTFYGHLIVIILNDDEIDNRTFL